MISVLHKGSDMYAVEFQADIKNGVVRIPREYKNVLSDTKATFVVMYEEDKKQISEKREIEKRLDEFDRLVAQSNNKVTATMELATNIDDMVLDGIF